MILIKSLYHNLKEILLPTVIAFLGTAVLFFIFYFFKLGVLWILGNWFAIVL